MLQDHKLPAGGASMHCASDDDKEHGGEDREEDENADCSEFGAWFFEG